MLCRELTAEQKLVALAPVGDPRATFLHGPAGCGKTTAAVQRMLYLLDVGVRADRLLVWVPQRSLGQPYVDALRGPTSPAGPRPTVLSVDGLARRMIDLLWVLLAEPAGFDPRLPPTFLTLETAQYYMAQALEPLLGHGLFGDVTLSRNRLLSQILDNLNKAALVGFPHTEIAQRLTGAWNGVSSRERVYEAVQQAANSFRAYCLEHSLLDFSLQMQTFAQHAWPLPLCKDYLLRSYRHLIVDNIEEDVPVSHDLLREWMAEASSALIVYDEGGGFRTYLGADPEGALGLATLCEEKVNLDRSFVSSAAIQALSAGLVRHNGGGKAEARGTSVHPQHLEDAIEPIQERFHTDLLQSVTSEAQRLIEREGVLPGEIAIVAPFVDDALRFALTTRLERLGVPVRTHRPSRALREEASVQCLLTLACIAHPQWGICPPTFDVAHALVKAVADLDWVRACYLTEIVYRRSQNQPQLEPFSRLIADAQERITYVLGGRYGLLQIWLESYQSEPVVMLDLFFSRLFDDLLAREGFGFHDDLDGAAAAASLIESSRKFRWALGEPEANELGRRYVSMVHEGVVAAQYLHRRQSLEADALFVGPAYTFLSENRAVEYQFWLNANSPSWGRRLYQPLTHPFVLSRHWPHDRRWTEEDEVQAGQDMLDRVVVGLLRRCRTRLYLGMSQLSSRGFEERGPLLARVQRLVRRTQRAEVSGV